MKPQRIGVRELRQRIAEVTHLLQEGNTLVLTYRHQPLGEIVPFRKPRLHDKPFQPVGFGLWAGRQDFREPSGWVRALRSGRRLRFS